SHAHIAVARGDQDPVGLETVIDVGELDRVAFVGLRRQPLDRLLLSMAKADRADAVLHADIVGTAFGAVAPFAQRQIAPAKFLHRPYARRLRFPVWIRLTFER